MALSQRLPLRLEAARRSLGGVGVAEQGAQATQRVGDALRAADFALIDRDVNGGQEPRLFGGEDAVPR